MGKRLKGRFAPSPTGRMHAGNVFAALMSWLIVKSQGGSIVLRLDDLDVERSRAECADVIMKDFELLGLTWDEGPYRQQGRDEAYSDAFRTLEQKGLVYPCFCTRADLKAASAPHRGEKAVYPGTCASLSAEEVRMHEAQRRPAWRIRVPDEDYGLTDLVQGEFSQNLASECGDFVIRRSDGLFAYQLATVVDDAEEGVNLIVRGMDLLVSTPQQAFSRTRSGCRIPHTRMCRCSSLSATGAFRSATAMPGWTSSSYDSDRRKPLSDISRTLRTSSTATSPHPAKISSRNSTYRI